MKMNKEECLDFLEHLENLDETVGLSPQTMNEVTKAVNNRLDEIRVNERYGIKS